MTPEISFFLGSGFARNILDIKTGRALPLLSDIEAIFRQQYDLFHDQCSRPDSGRSIAEPLTLGVLPASFCPISSSLIDELKDFYAARSGVPRERSNIEHCIGTLYEFELFVNRAGCTFQNFEKFVSNPIWGWLIKRLGPHIGSNLIRDLVQIPLSKCFPEPMFTDHNTFKGLEICEIFEMVFQKQKDINIFSLNWDLTVESYYQFDAKQDIFTGFVAAPQELMGRLPKQVRVGDVRVWNPAGFIALGRKLIKMHGSLNWRGVQPFRMDLATFRYKPDYLGGNDYPSLIESAGSTGWLDWLDHESVKTEATDRRFIEHKSLLVGLEKESHYLYEPYATLINTFKTSVNRVGVIYVIGYGFGDDGMNDIMISSALQRATSVNPLCLIIVSRDSDDADKIITSQPALDRLHTEKPELVQAFRGGVRDLREEVALRLQ